MKKLLTILFILPLFLQAQVHRHTKAVSITNALPYIWATLNPSDKSANITLSGGNLTFTTSGGTSQLCRSTYAMAVNTKTYIEVTAMANTTSADNMIGWCTAATSTSSYPGSDLNGYGMRLDVGDIRRNGSNNAYTTALSDGHVWGFAFDLTSGAATMTLYVDNVSRGAFSIADGPYYFAVGGVNSFNFGATVNFGATSFTYTPPAGFSGLHN